MCTMNLKEVGWSKFGENLEEEQMWKKSTKQRERDQIKEAVTYYIENHKKKQYRSIILSESRHKINWEINLKIALRNLP